MASVALDTCAVGAPSDSGVSHCLQSSGKDASQQARLAAIGIQVRVEDCDVRA
jgi:hypothetical protein